MPTRTLREACQPTRHRGGSSCFPYPQRASNSSGKTNRPIASTFVPLEDRVLSYLRSDAPFSPFLHVRLTAKLPAIQNDQYLAVFFIRSVDRRWIGLHAYMHDIYRFSTRFLPAILHRFDFSQGERRRKRMKIESVTIAISLRSISKFPRNER